MSATPAGTANGAAATLVRAVDLVKRYPLFLRRRDRAIALVTGASPSGSMTALDRVSFTADAGEAVGLIGENGSGKSTLLRVVAGISAPDGGRLEVDGLVAAILELGVGFHPDFTGRDNAVFYGSLVGVPELVMRERLDEIVAFAELGDSVDQPVRTYSTGMAARLAFAVATHVDPRVLVVDEALAVGDGAFQKKCIDRMVRTKDEGRAVLFCSHSMHLVSGFCERALWLRRGQVEACGPTRDVVQAYDEFLRHRERRAEALHPSAQPRGVARIRSVVVEPAGREVEPGEALAVRVAIERHEGSVPLHLAVVFDDQTGQCLACFATLWDGRDPLVGGPEQTVGLRLQRPPFARGEIDVTAVLADDSGLQVIDQVVGRRAIRIRTQRWEPGLFTTDHQWEST